MAVFFMAVTDRAHNVRGDVLYPFPSTCVRLTLRSGLQGCACIFTFSFFSPQIMLMYSPCRSPSPCAPPATCPAHPLKVLALASVPRRHCGDGDGISVREEMRLGINEVGGGGGRGKRGERGRWGGQYLSRVEGGGAHGSGARSTETG